MKIDKPINQNYCATVVKIANIVPLENCDNVVATTIFGLQAIVGKDTKIGDIGIVFPAETQLSEDFCKNNNLYRHAEKNKDTTQQGYIEDNRRIKAVKFRGNVSNCLFSSLDSLLWTKIKLDSLVEGDSFDFLNGKGICKKFVIKIHEPRANHQHVPKFFQRVEPKYMPEHFDTENYFKNVGTLNPETDIIVSQKIHGTSIRIGNTQVLRKLNLFEKGLKKLGVKIQEREFDYVYASRKVVKDINSPYAQGFYDTDIWTEEGSKLKGLIPENYIIYAELVGWTSGGGQIQEDYNYGIEKGKAELYVYRVAIINNQGISQDLCWDHMIEFCKSVGLKTVCEVWRGKLKDFKVDDFINKRFFEEGYRNCLSLGDNKDLVDEGVVVRVDRRTPYCLKAKSPIFLEHETRILDKGVEDLESSQTEVEDETIK